jgi:hypothetical protein
MIDYISGALFMYIFAMPLLLYITEEVEDDSFPFGRILFAIMWPLASLEALIKMLRGNEDDRTGSN